MKSIIKIKPNIVIVSDGIQYIVEHLPGGNRYYPTLDMCFQEIYETLVRNKLMDGKDRTLADIAQAIREIREEIFKIMKPFMTIKGHIKEPDEA
jgi:hypothetical protein